MKLYLARHGEALIENKSRMSFGEKGKSGNKWQIFSASWDFSIAYLSR
jgi:hypothetical protein